MQEKSKKKIFPPYNMAAAGFELLNSKKFASEAGALDLSTTQLIDYKGK